MPSKQFCERPPEIIFLFDLRINKFFGNGPPTVCPECSSIWTRLVCLHHWYFSIRPTATSSPVRWDCVRLEACDVIDLLYTVSGHWDGFTTKRLHSVWRNRQCAVLPIHKSISDPDLHLWQLDQLWAMADRVERAGAPNHHLYNDNYAGHHYHTCR